MRQRVSLTIYHTSDYVTLGVLMLGASGKKTYHYVTMLTGKKLLRSI